MVKNAGSEVDEVEGADGEATSVEAEGGAEGAVNTDQEAISNPNSIDLDTGLRKETSLTVLSRNPAHNAYRESRTRDALLVFERRVSKKASLGPKELKYPLQRQ